MPIRRPAPLAALIFAFAIPAHAGAPEAQPQPTTTATNAATNGATNGIVVQGQADPKQRKVCHTEVSTGSVMPKRTCRTVAEQELAQRQADRDMDRLRDRQLSGDQTTGLR
jgi:hypothetical protein